MDKPMIVAMEELKANIIKSISDSHLPVCVVEPLVKDIYTDIQNMYAQQFQKEKAEYYQSLVREKEGVTVE